MNKQSKAILCVCTCKLIRHMHPQIGAGTFRGRCKDCECEKFVSCGRTQQRYVSKLPTEKQMLAMAKARSVKKPKHGMTGTPTYKCWREMLKRCKNKNCISYPNYGGRGISVCDRWNTFVNFFADMGVKPPKMQIDRKEVNGNYEPSNCKWSTLSEQANNKRNSVFIEYDGERHTLPDWSRLTGVPFWRLRRRFILGWSAERILKTE